MNNSSAFAKQLNVWQAVIAVMIDEWIKHLAFPKPFLLSFFLSSYLLFLFSFFGFFSACLCLFGGGGVILLKLMRQIESNIISSSTICDNVVVLYCNSIESQTDAYIRHQNIVKSAFRLVRLVYRFMVLTSISTIFQLYQDWPGGHSTIYGAKESYYLFRRFSVKSVKIGGNDCFHNEKFSGDAIFDVIIYHSGVLTERKWKFRRKKILYKMIDIMR